MLKKSIGLFVIKIILFSVCIHGAHILAVFPHSYRSHLNLGEVIFEELINRGHKITIVSQFRLQIQHVNISNVIVDGAQDHLSELGFAGNDYRSKKDQYVNEELINTVYETTALMNYTLGYPNVQELIKGPAIFDMLLIDSYFSDSLLGLAYHWKIPVIALCARSANKWSNELVGNPHKPAYNPSIYSENSDRMSILERLFNSLESAFEDITYNYMYLSSQEAIFKRYFEQFQPKRQSLPPLIDIIHNVSLVLLNSHPAIHYPRPYVPNMIQIGGIHITENPEKAMPYYFEGTSSADDGIILISLGHTKSSDLPAELIDAFAKVFANLAGNIRVIWKWENETLLGQPAPENVITGSWLPQQSILSHPNVRLFITNGGIFSIMEAVYFGVPIIGIPLFGDQHFNVALSQNRGFGIKLDVKTTNETIIQNAIETVLNNPIYRQNALDLSQVFKDNPVNQMDNAIYYIEHVLRTNGAKHLRSASVDLPMWQQNLIDVWLIIAICIVIILAIPATIICIVLKRSHHAADSNNDNKDILSASIKKIRRNSGNKKIK